MQDKQFQKLDTNLSAMFYSEIKDGNSAKINGIALLIAGIFAWALIPVCLCLSSFKTDCDKYFIIGFFIIFGIVCQIGAIFYLRRNHQYKAIIVPILKNGLITEGYVTNIEDKRRFRGLFSRRGWHYKIFYNYLDNHGTEQKGMAYFYSNEQKEFAEKITIAFYNGQSVMVEFIEIP